MEAIQDAGTIFLALNQNDLRQFFNEIYEQASPSNFSFII